jgi:hypothetical protein
MKSQPLTEVMDKIKQDIEDQILTQMRNGDFDNPNEELTEDERREAEEAEQELLEEDEILVNN